MERQVKLYALSTCAWCKKTKKFLEERNVEYEGIDIHLHGSPCYPAQAELTSSIGSVEQEEIVHRDIAVLEESMAKDASREKIYSDKLGRWILAKPGKSK